MICVCSVYSFSWPCAELREFPACSKCTAQVVRLLRRHIIYDYYYTSIPCRGGEQWWIYTETQNVAQDIYPPLFTDPEGDSCFSVYQIRARLFKRRLTANPGLNRLNLRLNFNLRLVRLFEGKVMLIPG